jgi:hypothetical protein
MDELEKDFDEVIKKNDEICDWMQKVENKEIEVEILKPDNYRKI